MYYALVRSAESKAANEAQIEAFKAASEEEVPEADLAMLTVTDFAYHQEGPFNKYKPAFRAVTPMLDKVVPHPMNLGFVSKRPWKGLPLDKLDLPPAQRPKVLNTNVLRFFFLPGEYLTTIRAIEDSVASSGIAPPCPEGIRQVPYDLAVERGQARFAAGVRAPDNLIANGLIIPTAIEDLSRDTARKVAALLSIPGRGTMKAPDLRAAIEASAKERGLPVVVMSDAIPELRGA